MLITNRKTDRRQSRPKPLIERIVAIHDRITRKFPTPWSSDVRVGFFLPKFLWPFVASGPHGAGVEVLRGFVQLRDGSAEECFQSATHFFEVIAKDRPAFSVLAVITRVTPKPELTERRVYARYLSVVNGAMVVSSAMIDPKIYGALTA